MAAKISGSSPSYGNSIIPRELVKIAPAGAERMIANTDVVRIIYPYLSKSTRSSSVMPVIDAVIEITEELKAA